MGYSKNSEPTSLKECYETNYVADKLWEWAKWLESWGFKILVLLILIGIVSTISQAVQVAKISEDLVMVTAATSALSWALYAFIEYCAYNALALLISALATIVENTTITAKVAVYRAAKEEKGNDKSKATSNKESSVSATPKTVPTEIPVDGWKCKWCEAMNEKTVTVCRNCGKYK